MTPTLIRAYEASAAIDVFKIVTFSDVSASSKVATASVNTNPVLGVSGSMATAIGDMVDVIQPGMGQRDTVAHTGRPKAFAFLQSVSRDRGIEPISLGRNFTQFLK